MHLFIAQRILLTLAYTDQFNFPLSIQELNARLLVGFPTSTQIYLESILFLHEKKLIKYVDGYFFVSGLSDQKMRELSQLRKKRAEYSLKKWKEVQEFVYFARFVPFITGVAVTGSLAVNNVTKDDDVDFMLVTSNNRLWITRLLVILYATLRGKRRSFAKEEKNSWCFNLWVEESDLQLPVGSRSVYEANEVIQAKWVFSKNSVASRFQTLNSWTNSILYTSHVDYLNIEYESSMLWEIPVLSQFLSLFNLCMYYLQYIYMKPHMTREKVSRTHAFFHPRDTRSEVFKNWKRTLLRLI